VPGVPVGSHFPLRRDAAEAGVHKPYMQGISGSRVGGSDSIVVSGGYVDDEDHGDVIIYTGHGGNDSATRRQIADQDIAASGNAGLIISQLEGLPVRVIRGANGDSSYAPTTGFRYDGLYRVADHWSKIGQDGFRIIQYRLEKLPDGDEPIASPVPGGPAPTRPVTVQRRIRSSAVIDRVKRAHRHRCQICHDVLEVEGGLYAEGAHIRGLGRPHEGPDVPSNVLCLCPNDHVRFDYGAIHLNNDLLIIDTKSGNHVGDLRTVGSHLIDLIHVTYHLNLWAS
jgi:predicted restriction endonuclease